MRMSIIRSKHAFTLIELMLVVAITSILAAIAIPKFTDMLTKAREGKTKGNLGTLTSTLKIYYADTDGLYPVDDLSCLVGDYISFMPPCEAAGHHSASNVVFNIDSFGGDLVATRNNDNGRWTYWNQNTSGQPSSWGDVWVGCTHTDTKDSTWSVY